MHTDPQPSHSCPGHLPHGPTPIRPLKRNTAQRHTWAGAAVIQPAGEHGAGCGFGPVPVPMPECHDSARLVDTVMEETSGIAVSHAVRMVHISNCSGVMRCETIQRESGDIAVLVCAHPCALMHV